MKKALLILITLLVGGIFAGAAYSETYSYTTIDVPGVTMTQVYGVSGNNIVGYYLDDDQSYHGFFATPVPELAAMLLLSSGLIGFVGFRRFKK
jgi:hypothetical protein